MRSGWDREGWRNERRGGSLVHVRSESIGAGAERAGRASGCAAAVARRSPAGARDTRVPPTVTAGRRRMNRQKLRSVSGWTYGLDRRSTGGVRKHRPAAGRALPPACAGASDTGPEARAATANSANMQSIDAAVAMMRVSFGTWVVDVSRLRVLAGRALVSQRTSSRPRTGHLSDSENRVQPASWSLSEGTPQTLPTDGVAAPDGESERSRTWASASKSSVPVPSERAPSGARSR